ncbi:hypothetical protein ACFYRD_03840 [Streptomyces hirsutus]|uniref:hypothetical protein n=1 Tax=Streptomyces hirsutus TaxID=35620 RepID=UPI00368549B1
MRERDDGEGRGRVETWGRASGNGQVYQSGADQYVIQIQLAEARSQTAHEARQRADVVVQVLTRAVGEWAAHCQELEEQVGRARAEGRAEARAEFAEKLKDAELRVIRAQSTMRQAEEERARAEALLAQAQEELARRRREAKRDAERERDAVSLPEHPGLSQERQDTEQFSDLMERAEAELGAVREELRQLGEEIDGDAGQVVEGQWKSRPATDERPPLSVQISLPGVRVDTARKSTARNGSLKPGPPRLFRVGVAWAVFMLPSPVPMLVVTANRAAYTSDEGPGELARFTAITVLVGAVLYALGVLLTMVAILSSMERKSELKAADLGVQVTFAWAVLLFVSAFFTPPDWPGPAGAWGRSVASWAGLG